MSFVATRSLAQQLTSLKASLMPPHRSAQERVEWLGATYAAIRRWKGASEVTVAQHICDTTEKCSDRAKLAGFLHEGDEALLGDWLSPVKDMMRAIGVYEQIEAELVNPAKAEMAHMLGAPWPVADHIKSEIKLIDLRLAATEYRDTVCKRIYPHYDNAAEPYPEMMLPWSQTKAEQRFLDMAIELVPALQKGGRLACG